MFTLAILCDVEIFIVHSHCFKSFTKIDKTFSKKNNIFRILILDFITVNSKRIKRNTFDDPFQNNYSERVTNFLTYFNLSLYLRS